MPRTASSHPASQTNAGTNRPVPAAHTHDPFAFDDGTPAPAASSQSSSSEGDDESTEEDEEEDHSSLLNNIDSASSSSAASYTAPDAAPSAQSVATPSSRKDSSPLASSLVQKQPCSQPHMNSLSATTPLERALDVLKNRPEHILGVKAVKNEEYKLQRSNKFKHDYEVQIEKTAKYILIPWQTDFSDDSQFHPVLEALWEDFRPWMDRALKDAGKPTPKWDGGRGSSLEVATAICYTLSERLAFPGGSFSYEDVPLLCQTTMACPFRAEEDQRFCAADAIATAFSSLSLEAANARVTVESFTTSLKVSKCKKLVLEVVGGNFDNFGHFLRAQCVDGETTFKLLAVAIRYPGRPIELRKMPAEWNRLSPLARIQAMVNMDGAFVAKVGMHCIAICNGIVFDNDCDVPFAINARGTPDAGALFAKISLQGGIDEGRQVCLLR
jgi:hypothetical protein